MAWEAKDFVAAYAAVLSTGVFIWTVGKEFMIAAARGASAQDSTSV